MTGQTREHRVSVKRIAEPIEPLRRPTSGVLGNLYRTDSYLVLNVGLPRCLPEHILVTAAPNALQVEADLHPGQEATEKQREYWIAELPSGQVRRQFPLLWDDLELHAVEAHFQNGLLTVTIPTKARDAYLHEKRRERLPEEELGDSELPAASRGS